MPQEYTIDMEQHPYRAGIATVIILAFVVFGTIWHVSKPSTPVTPTDSQTPIAPATSTPTASLPTTSSDTTGTQQISDGTILFTYSPSAFGLATNSDQIVVKSYIPACGDGTNNFEYCLYYKGATYSDTNFESAGLRIQKRRDLTSEKACLETPPTGYSTSTKPSATKNGVGHTTSGFWPIGDAGAGHSASGELYRLAHTEPLTGDLMCYEFETRIGITQFGNYPAGSIKEFTSNDKAEVQRMLRGILDRITLPDDTLIKFPNPVK